MVGTLSELAYSNQRRINATLTNLWHSDALMQCKPALFLVDDTLLQCLMIDERKWRTLALGIRREQTPTNGGMIYIRLMHCGTRLETAASEK